MAECRLTRDECRRFRAMRTPYLVSNVHRHTSDGRRGVGTIFAQYWRGGDAPCAKTIRAVVMSLATAQTRADGLPARGGGGNCPFASARPCVEHAGDGHVVTQTTENDNELSPMRRQCGQAQRFRRSQPV